MEGYRSFSRKNANGDDIAQYAVGDIHSNERGSGARANSGKVSLSLLPLHALAGAARVMMLGTKKYAPWNWAKGMQWSICVDCTLRHLFKWFFLGEDYDQESGQHHLDHVLCNVMFLRHYTMTYAKGDDRPAQEITEFRQSKDDFNTLLNLEETGK